MENTTRMAEEIAAEYKTSLEDLTVNSKPIINMLTMVAEENMDHAVEISRVIEERIRKAPPSQRLPVLYLVDSILKNVRRSYLQAFANNIVPMFATIFEKVDEKTRQSLYKLRQTWPSVFPNTKLYALDTRIAQIDPAWPVTAKPETAIHVNPKFLTTQPPSPNHEDEIRKQQTLKEERDAARRRQEAEAAKRILEEKRRQEEAKLKQQQKDSEAELREQLLAKQQELLHLERERLELELLEARAKLEQQNKMLQNKEQLMKEKLLAQLKKNESQRQEADSRTPDEPVQKTIISRDPRVNRDPRLKKHLAAVFQDKPPSSSENSSPSSKVENDLMDTDQEISNEPLKTSKQDKVVGQGELELAPKDHKIVSPNESGELQKKNKDKIDFNKLKSIFKNVTGKTSSSVSDNNNKDSEKQSKNDQSPVLNQNKGKIEKKADEIEKSNSSEKPVIDKIDDDKKPKTLQKDLVRENEPDVENADKGENRKPLNESDQGRKSSDRVRRSNRGAHSSSQSPVKELNDRKQRGKARIPSSHSRSRSRSPVHGSRGSHVRTRNSNRRRSPSSERTTRQSSRRDERSESRAKTKRRDETDSHGSERERNRTEKSNSRKGRSADNEPSRDDCPPKKRVKPDEEFAKPHSPKREPSKSESTTEQAAKENKDGNAISNDLADLFGKEDQDYRTLPPIPKLATNMQIDPSRRGLPSPAAVGWSKHKASHPENFPFAQPRPVIDIPRRTSVELFRTPLRTSPVGGPNLMDFHRRSDQQSPESRDGTGDILRQAEEQLRNGKLTKSQHTELIRQLSELNQLQHLKQQLREERTKIKQAQATPEGLKSGRLKHFNDDSRENIGASPPFKSPPAQRKDDSFGSSPPCNKIDSFGSPPVDPVEEPEKFGSLKPRRSLETRIPSPPHQAIDEPSQHLPSKAEKYSGEHEKSELSHQKPKFQKPWKHDTNERSYPDKSSRPPLLPNPEPMAPPKPPKQTLLPTKKTLLPPKKTLLPDPGPQHLLPGSGPQHLLPDHEPPHLSRDNNETYPVSSEQEMESDYMGDNQPDEMMDSESPEAPNTWSDPRQSDPEPRKPARFNEEPSTRSDPSQSGPEHRKPMHFKEEPDTWSDPHKSDPEPRKPMRFKEKPNPWSDARPSDPEPRKPSRFNDDSNAWSDPRQSGPEPRKPAHVEEEPNAWSDPHQSDPGPRKPARFNDDQDTWSGPRRSDPEPRKPAHFNDDPNTWSGPPRHSDLKPRMPAYENKVPSLLTLELPKMPPGTRLSEVGHDLIKSNQKEPFSPLDSPGIDLDQYYNPNMDPRWTKRAAIEDHPPGTYLVVIDERRKMPISPGQRRFISIGMDKNLFHEFRFNLEEKTLYVDKEPIYKLGDEPTRYRLDEMPRKHKSVKIYVTGLLKKLWIDGIQYDLHLDAPPKRVTIGENEHTIRVDSERNVVIVDGHDICPADGPPKKVQLAFVVHEIQYEPPPRHILIDGKLCELDLQSKFPRVVINGKPHGIRFDGPPRYITISKKQYSVAMDSPKVIKITNSRPLLVGFGGPGHEVIVEDRIYEVKFGDPPKKVKYGNNTFTIGLSGPAPEVKILGEFMPEDKMQQGLIHPGQVPHNPPMLRPAMLGPRPQMVGPGPQIGGPGPQMGGPRQPMLIPRPQMQGMMPGPGQPMQGPGQPMQGPEQPMPGPGQPMQGNGQPMQGPRQPMLGPGQPMQGPAQPMQGPGQPMPGPGQPMQGPGQPMQGPGQPMQGPGQPMQGPGQPMQGPGQPMQGPGQPMQGPGQPMQGPGQPMQGPGQPMQGPPQTFPGPGQPMMGPGHQGPLMMGPGNQMQAPWEPVQGQGLPMHGSQQRMQGPPQQIQGPPQQMMGIRQPMPGPPQSMTGPMPGPPQSMSGPMPGPPQSMSGPMPGPPQSMSGPMPCPGMHGPPIMPGQPIPAPGQQMFPGQQPMSEPAMFPGQQGPPTFRFPEPMPQGMPNQPFMQNPNMVPGNQIQQRQPFNDPRFNQTAVGTPPMQPSGGPPPMMNVDDLLKRLVTAGIIQHKDDQPKQEGHTQDDTEPDMEEMVPRETVSEIPDLTRFKLDRLKIHYQGARELLSVGIQCASCGLRFVPEQKDQYKEHLDWHFRQNKKGMDDMKVARHRRWYYSVQDWIEYEEIGDLEQRAQSAYFEQVLQISAQQAQTGARGLPGQGDVVSCPAVSGEEGDDVCGICCEPFEQFWDEDEEEWHMKDAIRAKGQTYHPVCYEDVSESNTSLLETPSADLYYNHEAPPLETDDHSMDSHPHQSQEESAKEKSPVKDQSPPTVTPTQPASYITQLPQFTDMINNPLAYLTSLSQRMKASQAATATATTVPEPSHSSVTDSSKTAAPLVATSASIAEPSSESSLQTQAPSGGKSPQPEIKTETPSQLTMRDDVITASPNQPSLSNERSISGNISPIVIKPEPTEKVAEARGTSPIQDETVKSFDSQQPQTISPTSTPAVVSSQPIMITGTLLPAVIPQADNPQSSTPPQASESGGGTPVRDEPILNSGGGTPVRDEVPDSGRGTPVEDEPCLSDARLQLGSVYPGGPPLLHIITPMTSPPIKPEK